MDLGHGEVDLRQRRVRLGRAREGLQRAVGPALHAQAVAERLLHAGRLRRHLLKLAQALLRQPQVARAEAVAEVWVCGIDLHERAVVLDGAGPVARGLVRAGQLAARERLARRELHGLLQLGLGLGGPAEGEQARAEQDPGRRVGRVEPDRLAKLRRGLRVLPSLLVHDAEVVADVGHTGAALDHPPEGGLGLVEPAGLQRRVAGREHVRQLAGGCDRRGLGARRRRGGRARRLCRGTGWSRTDRLARDARRRGGAGGGEKREGDRAGAGEHGPIIAGRAPDAPARDPDDPRLLLILLAAAPCRRPPRRPRRRSPSS